jgi:hypothetical protein
MVVFGYYNGWQWTDEQDGVYDPRKAKKRWKAASVLLRVIAVSAPVVFYYFPVNIKHLAISTAISLTMFDMTINLTRGVYLFYLGSTSKTDRIGWFKWITYLIIIGLTIYLAIKY